MNRITADRALFQNFRSIFGFEIRWAKCTRPAVSLLRISAPVNRKLEFSEERTEAPDGTGKDMAAERIESRLLILAEELLGVFNEADDHHDRGAGHAHEEQDLQDVHCKQSNLKHVNDCNPDDLGISSLRSVCDARWGFAGSGPGRNLLCQCEIDERREFAIQRLA
jgi:hypothetical protein